MVKFDVLIPPGADGTAAKGMQFIFGDQWNYWYGDACCQNLLMEMDDHMGALSLIGIFQDS